MPDGLVLVLGWTELNCPNLSYLSNEFLTVRVCHASINASSNILTRTPYSVCIIVTKISVKLIIYYYART